MDELYAKQIADFHYYPVAFLMPEDLYRILVYKENLSSDRAREIVNECTRINGFGDIYCEYRGEL